MACETVKPTNPIHYTAEDRESNLPFMQFSSSLGTLALWQSWRDPHMDTVLLTKPVIFKNLPPFWEISLQARAVVAGGQAHLVTS